MKKRLSPAISGTRLNNYPPDPRIAVRSQGKGQIRGSMILCGNVKMPILPISYKKRFWSHPKCENAQNAQSYKKGIYERRKQEKKER